MGLSEPESRGRCGVTKMNEDLPAFLRISQDERRAAWERYRAKQSAKADTADSVDARQHELRQQHDMARKRKARGRVGKMLARKGDQAALRAGLTWNARTAQWED